MRTSNPTAPAPHAAPWAGATPASPAPASPTMRARRCAPAMPMWWWKPPATPAAGIAHARAAFAAGRHIVMVNVEADVLAGPLLAAGSPRCRRGLHHGLRRPARTDLRTGGMGPHQRLRRGGRGQGHQVPAVVPRLDTRYGLGTLRPHRSRGAGRGHEQPHVQLLPRRHQVRHRDGGHRQRHRPHATSGRARVPALQPG